MSKKLLMAASARRVYPNVTPKTYGGRTIKVSADKVVVEDYLGGFLNQPLVFDSHEPTARTALTQFRIVANDNLIIKSSYRMPGAIFDLETGTTITNTTMSFVPGERDDPPHVDIEHARTVSELEKPFVIWFERR